jgi:hypothetical protein
VATVLQDNENEMNQRYPAGSRGHHLATDKN